MTMTKAFALPRIPGIGEGSQLQVQMSAFNLFNNLNLTNLDTVITDPHFGQATCWPVNPSGSFITVSQRGHRMRVGMAKLG